jgi:hypothetical protein
MRSGTSVTTWLSLLALPLMLSACAHDEAVPTASTAEYASKAEADQALQQSQQALQTAQKAEQDAQAANQRAGQMYDRSQRK